MRNNEKGFSALEALLVILVVVLIGGAGWYVWQSRADNNAPTNDTGSTNAYPTENTPKTDPYEGWETYTLKYERFSFKYPKSYAIDDESSTANPDVKPGHDRLKLTKDNGFVIFIETGLDGIGGGCQTCKLALSKEITLFDEPAYLNFRAEENGQVGSVIVASDKTNLFGGGIEGKNVRLTGERGGTVLPLGISMHYENNGAIVEESLTKISNSEDIAEAIKILESASY